MNILEWWSIPFQDRNKLKVKYGIRPSGIIKTISGGAVDIIESDGITEGDLAPLAQLKLEKVLKDLELPLEAPKEEPKEEPIPKIGKSSKRGPVSSVKKAVRKSRKPRKKK